MGHQATVYEMLPKLGGMLRYGIPNYQSARKTGWIEDINAILKTGVEVKHGLKIGEDVTIQQLRSAVRCCSDYQLEQVQIRNLDWKAKMQTESYSAVQFLRDVGKEREHLT